MNGKNKEAVELWKVAHVFWSMKEGKAALSILKKLNKEELEGHEALCIFTHFIIYLVRPFTKMSGYGVVTKDYIPTHTTHDKKHC